MTLYDIDESIAALIDPETGEITDYDALDALTMAREDKIKQIIFALRNAEAEAVVIRCEIDRLGDKLETAERGVESVKKYLEYALRGEKYKDAYFILTDYFAASDSEEATHRSNLLALKREEGINDGEFYHYDTPLTVMHETEALLEAGFSAVEVIDHWGATFCLRATV